MDPALLILDLDETLIHCCAEPLAEPPHFRAADYAGYRRPGLLPFLERAAAHYRLAIWSSAGDQYVAEVAAAAIGETVDFDFVWGNSRGTLRRDFDRDEWFYAKPLRKLRRRERLERVLIVDDDPRKVASSYGNAIYVREFEGDGADDELSLLGRYLDSIKDTPNFRRLEKRHWRRTAERLET